MTKIEQLWRELRKRNGEAPHALDTGFRLTRVDAASRFDIYGGLDASGFVIFAICIAKRPPNLHTESSALEYFRQQRTDKSWLMILRLRQDGLEGVFGRLCQDLIDATTAVADESTLLVLFRDRLNLWKKLFHKSRTGLLTNSEIRGLIGELLTLELLVKESGSTAADVVNAWVGPLGADQDFRFAGSALEVKSHQPGAEAVSIASLEQLDAGVPMELVTVQLTQAATGDADNVSLNALVARIEGLVASDGGAPDIFKDRLLEAGYVESDFYDTALFVPGEMIFYSVSEGFPHITRNSLAEGILSASYAISLKDIEAFEIRRG